MASTIQYPLRLACCCSFMHDIVVLRRLWWRLHKQMAVWSKQQAALFSHCSFLLFIVSLADDNCTCLLVGCRYYYPQKIVTFCCIRRKLSHLIFLSGEKSPQPPPHSQARVNTDNVLVRCRKCVFFLFAGDKERALWPFCFLFSAFELLERG